jgi:hypothetical protein
MELFAQVLYIISGQNLTVPRAPNLRQFSLTLTHRHLKIIDCLRPALFTY